jgi:hypothetical protein
VEALVINPFRKGGSSMKHGKIVRLEVKELQAGPRCIGECDLERMCKPPG